MRTKINRERIKVLRLGKAWTQQKLADESGISLRSMQRIEAEGIASLQSRAAIATAFTIEASDLEIDEIQPTSVLGTLFVVVVFGYVSFYLGLEIFDIPLGELPNWSIPIIPSTTMLIFGVILLVPMGLVRKAVSTALGCVFLAMLLSPPDPLNQLLYASILWVAFEALVLGVSFLLRRAVSFQRQS